MKKKMLGFMAMVMAGVMLMTGCAGTKEAASGAAVESQKETVAAEGKEKSPEGKTYKVAAIVKSQSEVWAAWLSKSLQNRAKDFPDMEITLFDAQNDQTKTVQYIEMAVTQKFDLIIVQKVAASDTNELFQSVVNDDGIPIIAVNIPVDDGVTYNIPAPNYDLGYTMGEVAAKNLPENANILIMRGKVVDVEQQRYNGLKAALLDKRPDITVLDEKVANYSRDEGMKLMENWLQVYPDFDGLIALSDSMAIGGVEACKAVQNFNFDEVQIYGVDGLADSCLAIKDGKMTATVLQDADLMAKEAIELGHKILTGEVTERQDIMIKTEVIDKSNVDSYIAKHKENGILE
ncbi:MAG: sugar ABC transporter substrate-binding protein [Lachnospiraceae bacterium]|nr:sugar ABC transporter substrate-binding protein [Lachnospiraceae bacterium]